MEDRSGQAGAGRTTLSCRLIGITMPGCSRINKTVPPPPSAPALWCTRKCTVWTRENVRHEDHWEHNWNLLRLWHGCSLTETIEVWKESIESLIVHRCVDADDTDPHSLKDHIHADHASLSIWSEERAMYQVTAKGKNADPTGVADGKAKECSTRKRCLKSKTSELHLKFVF